MISLFSHHLAQNQFFSGLAGASIIAGALYYLRSIPKLIWEWVRWAGSLEVEISNDSPIYEAILRWVTQRTTGKWYNRSFKLVEDGNQNHGVPNDSDSPRPRRDWLLSPGYGKSWAWFERRAVLVRREAKNEQHASHSMVRETINLRIFSTDYARLARLIDSFREATEATMVPVYLWRADYWALIDRRRPRDLESVVLPDGKMEMIAADLRRFLASEAWYVERGVPYRRGYLFAGPPGTGKSSAALAFASAEKLPLYALNLGSLTTDNELIDAVSSVPANAILLIEDVDSSLASRDREVETKLTLPALLNAVDGAYAREGRILILTANDPSRVAPALLRPGRVDVRVEFRLSAAPEAARMFERFFVGERRRAAQLAANGFDARVAAEIQEILAAHPNDPQAAFEALMK